MNRGARLQHKRGLEPAAVQHIGRYNLLALAESVTIQRLGSVPLTKDIGARSKLARSTFLSFAGGDERLVYCCDGVSRSTGL